MALPPRPVGVGSKGQQYLAICRPSNCTVRRAFQRGVRAKHFGVHHCRRRAHCGCAGALETDGNPAAGNVGCSLGGDFARHMRQRNAGSRSRQRHRQMPETSRPVERIGFYRVPTSRPLQVCCIPETGLIAGSHPPRRRQRYRLTGGIRSGSLRGGHSSFPSGPKNGCGPSKVPMGI